MAQISYIKYKDYVSKNRFDAEFFKSKYIENEKLILDHPNDILINLSNKIDVGFVGSMTSQYVNKGVLLLQTKNIDEFNLNLSQNVYINENFHKKLKKSQIHKGDILIARSGSFGKASIYLDDEVVNSSDIIIVNPNTELLNKYYLVSFLNSKFGANQLYQFASGGLQGHVNLTILENLRIPILPSSFQMQIEKMIISAHNKLNESKSRYTEAQDILLIEIGLLDYENIHSLSFSSTKKEIIEANRIDSEYYQPRYKEIINKIENYVGGYDLVKNQFNQNIALSKKDGVFYNYIEISDVNTTNGEIIPNKISTKNIPANGKRKLHKGDLLVSKVRPYRGAVSYIDFEDNNLLGSGAFTVLQERTDYKKEVLMVFLKTQVIKGLLLRYNCGTSYPVIRDENILNLKIPLIKQSTQKQIARNIKKSHKLRKESKDLLEKAKKMVEDKIEKKNI